MKNITFITIIIVITFILVPSAFAQQATLSLSPSAGTFNRSCTFTLDIRLDTAAAQTDGTDAIVIYDPTRFSATSITSGSIYTEYPGNNICESDNLCPGIGRILVSGLSSVSSAFSGQGTLATVKFTVKDNAPTGATQVKFDFDPSDKAKTTDSNVVQRGNASDILSSVVNGNYTIGTGTCGTAETTGAKGAAGAVSTPSGQAKTLDKLVDKTGKGAGTPELTYTLAIAGSVLVVLGILGLALL